MADRFVVNLTRAKEDADRATVAFVVANAAVASDKETAVFLSIEGVRLSQRGYADDVHVDGFAPLLEVHGGRRPDPGVRVVLQETWAGRRAAD
jgi:predicted peroxiredoxin